MEERTTIPNDTVVISNFWISKIGAGCVEKKNTVVSL